MQFLFPSQVCKIGKSDSIVSTFGQPKMENNTTDSKTGLVAVVIPVCKCC